MTENIEAPTNPEVRIIKTADCTSLSGKAIITYAISVNSGGNAFINLVSSTGAGRLNTDLIPFRDIEEIFRQQPKGVEIRSSTFASAYVGKSTNSKGYLLSCLLAERLVKPIPTKEYCFEACDPTSWLKLIHALALGPVESGAGPVAKVDRKRLVSKASTRRPQPDPVVY
jgi:hypothetical protein